MQKAVITYGDISKDNWMGITHHSGIHDHRDIHGTDIVRIHVGLSRYFRTDRKGDTSEE